MDIHSLTIEAPARGLDKNATAPGEHECLPHYLDRMVTAFGCDNGLRWAEQWHRRHKTPGLLRWLRSRGGYCDCEVLFNVYPDFWPEDGPTPPCAGIPAPGSAEPCR
jgi:hypothetical protein